MSSLADRTARWMTASAMTLAAGLVGCAGAEEAPAPKDNRANTQSQQPDAPDSGTTFALPAVPGALLAPFKVYHSEVKVGGKPAGYIDWSGKRIVSVGRSTQAGPGPAKALAARRGAEIIALRNALALSAGVRIGINGRINGLKDGTVALQGFLKDFQVTRAYSKQKQGRVYWIAEVHVPMFGVRNVAAKVYDAQLRAHSAMVAGMGRALWARPTPDDGDLLVIDARELGFNPSMYPLVVSEDRRILIDMQTVGRDTAIRRGLCAYATTDLKFERLQSLRGLTPSERRIASLAAGPALPGQNVDGIGWDRVILAQAVAAAGESSSQEDHKQGAATAPATSPATQPTTSPRRRPRRFVVRARRAQGKEKAILVIDNKDSLKLLKDPRAAGMARDGRVLVVVDAAAAAIEGLLPPLRSPAGQRVEIAIRER